METKVQEIDGIAVLTDPTYWMNVLLGKQDKQYHPTAILPGKAVILFYEGQSNVLIRLDSQLDERSSLFEDEDAISYFSKCGLPETGWV